MVDSILAVIQQGRVYCADNNTYINELLWHEHPKFSGVALKHLITGEDTGGTFSSHLVRVNAGCEIGEHLHAGKWELHEVIQGKGKCTIANQEIYYSKGVAAVIPADIPHRIQASENDLYVLAKFVPALL